MRLALALLVVALAACGRTGGPPRRDLAFGPAQPAKATPLVSTRTIPTVTLIDAGQEPRRELRYHPATGSTQKVKVVQKTKAPLVPIVTNEVVTRAEVKVGEVTAGGARLAETVVVSNIGTPAAGKTAEAEQQELATGLGDRHIDVQLDPQGRSAEPRIISVVGILVAVLPAEPVGIGARWRVTTERVQYLVGESATEYELLSADGDQLVLRSQSSFKSPPQRLVGPVEVKSMTATGTGECHVDLTRVLPRADKQELATEMHFNTTDEGEFAVKARSEIVISEEE